MPGALLEVIYIDRDADIYQVTLDERFHLGPLAASQTAPDSRHMDRRPQLLRLGTDLLEALGHRLVPDGRPGTAPFDAALADHVGDPDVRLDLDELHSPEGEPAVFARRMPLAVLGLWLLPPLGDGEDEPFAPTADVVTDMTDDLHPFCLGRSGITLDVCDIRHSRRLRSSTI